MKTCTPNSSSTTSEWRAAQAELAGLILAPTRREEVTVSAAVGRVLAEPLCLRAHERRDASALAAGTLIKWTHLPLFVAAACRTVGVRARVRAGIVTVADRVAGAPQRCPADEATAALLGAVFEKMGGQSFLASNPEPGHRLRPVLEMFADRCELIFVVGDLDPQTVQTLKPRTSRSGVFFLHIGSTLVLFLPPRLQAALVSFVVFVVPLVRKLQGRGDALPLIRQVHAPELAGTQMCLVSERFVGDRITVCACDESLGAQGLAGISGITWRPEDHAQALAYLPFEEWLGR